MSQFLHRTTVAETLIRYGYSLSGDRIITPKGHATHVSVHFRTGGYVVLIGQAGRLWSGPASSVGEFMERFWFARAVG